MKKISEWPKWGRITFYVFVAFLVLICPPLIIPLVAWWVIRRYLRWSAGNRLAESAARLESGAAPAKTPFFPKDMKSRVVLLVLGLAAIGSCLNSMKDGGESSDDDSMTEVPSQYEGQSFMGFKFGETNDLVCQQVEYWDESGKDGGGWVNWTVRTPIKLLDLRGFEQAHLYYTAQTKRLYRIVIFDEFKTQHPFFTDETKELFGRYSSTIREIVKAKYGVDGEFGEKAGFEKKRDTYEIGSMRLYFTYGFRRCLATMAMRDMSVSAIKKSTWGFAEVTVEDENMVKVAKAELHRWEKEEKEKAEKTEREEREERVKSAKDLL